MCYVSQEEYFGLNFRADGLSGPLGSELVEAISIMAALKLTITGWDTDYYAPYPNFYGRTLPVTRFTTDDEFIISNLLECQILSF